MSIFAIGFSTEAMLALIGAIVFGVARFARPLLGTFALVAAIVLFRPLLMGLLRAALLLVHPRHTFEQRRARARFSTVVLLSRLATRGERLDPSQAAELRNLAARA
ncbi:MAG: hypothetical protein ABI351_05035 [Herbaspirillum sp.]